MLLLPYITNPLNLSPVDSLQPIKIGVSTHAKNKITKARVAVLLATKKGEER